MTKWADLPPTVRSWVSVFIVVVIVLLILAFLGFMSGGWDANTG